MKITKLSLLLVLTTNIVFAQGNQNNQNPDNQDQAKLDQEDTSTIADKAEAQWANPDYRPYEGALNELIKLSDTFAQNKLALTETNFQTGNSIIFKMREEVQRFREESADAKKLNEKWYWQTVDRKAREERIIAMKKQKAKLRAVTYFTRAINHMDEIQNRNIRESEQFKNLQANLYRKWVIQQYDLGNIPQTIDLLERYLKLDPRFEREISPHKYLASAYSFKETLMNKYSSGTESERLKMKKEKNKHLLRATELRYKKGSPEYESMLEVINRDEVITIKQD